MRTECARQLCNRFAVAMCAIDASASAVRLTTLDPRVVGTPLCRLHADRLAPPVGWLLRDERPTVPGASPGAAATREGDGETNRADVEGLLDARTPLLSRAFRAVSPGEPEHVRSRPAT